MCGAASRKEHKSLPFNKGIVPRSSRQSPVFADHPAHGPSVTRALDSHSARERMTPSTSSRRHTPSSADGWCEVIVIPRLPAPRANVACLVTSQNCEYGCTRTLSFP